MRLIALRRPVGFFTVVDDDDYDWISSLRLRATFQSQRWNPVRSSYHAQHGRAWLHRMILERDDKPLGRLVVNHRNGWGLDNRRVNLRPVTLTHASRLARQKAPGKRVCHRHQCLGRFETREAAAEAKLAAEIADGFPVIENQAELRKPLIAFLELCVSNGTLRRHQPASLKIESQYRMGGTYAP